MGSGRRILHLCVSAACFLGGAALTVFLADPFFHYHEPWFGLKPVGMQNEKEYQIPGMLLNFEYDSVLAGSSVVMSMNTGTLNERFSCRTVKAVGGSAAAPLLDYYLDLAFSSHEIANVFYGVDVFSFYNQPDMRVVSEDVEFLVNRNPLDDVRYLWNMDVIGEKVPEMIRRSLRANVPDGMMYQLNADAALGPEGVLAMHCPGAGKLQKPKPADFQGTYVEENISRLERRVRENPDTRFFFFIPPYSIVWWDDAYEKGLLDAYLHTLARCMERLLPYENSAFYATDFNEPATIADMYQYMDYIHGGVMVTERMAQQVGTPDNEITPDNYQQHLDKLRTFFEKFRRKVEAEGYGFVYERWTG